LNFFRFEEGFKPALAASSKESARCFHQVSKAANDGLSWTTGCADLASRGWEAVSDVGLTVNLDLRLPGLTGVGSAHSLRSMNQTKRSSTAPGATGQRPPLYTPEQRVRRDSTVWTLVQGILAPVQFLVFIVSAVLVVRFLLNGEGWFEATVSVVIKTLVLYTIMVTGAIWEKVVFGQYLLAPAFFWEDVFSFLVLALHTAYLVALFTGALTPREQMLLAMAAYATYVINAAQFIWKLRMARLDEAARRAAAPLQGAAA